MVSVWSFSSLWLECVHPSPLVFPIHSLPSF